MDVKCENCSEHGANTQRITMLEKRVAVLEDDLKDSTRRLSVQERDGAVMENKLDNIMVAIEKIEKSVDRIDKRLEALEAEKGKKWEWLMYLVGGGFIMAVLQFVMQYILKKGGV